MPKPRLLIPVFTHFSVRYILRTGMLTALTEFTQPIVALSWQDPALENEFSQAGAEILHVPNFTFSSQFKETRELVNFWHKQVRQTNTTEIDIRREASLLGLRERVNYEVQILKDRIKTALPARIPHLLQQEESLFWSETNYQEFDAILDQSKPYAVFSITPFVNKEEPLLRCAQKRGVLQVRKGCPITSPVVPACLFLLSITWFGTATTTQNCCAHTLISLLNRSPFPVLRSLIFTTILQTSYRKKNGVPGSGSHLRDRLFFSGAVHIKSFPMSRSS